MSDQYPTQPGWGQPPPDQTQPWTQPPPPTPPTPRRPWFKRGWFLLLVGFVAGGIVGAAGSDPQATGERKVFTENCAELDAAERQRCEVVARRHDLELTRAEVRGRQEAREESVSTTSTPKPAATQPPAITISDGVYEVGAEIKPGTYKTRAADTCYWARLADPDGSNILANHIGSGLMTLRVRSSDKYIELSGGCEWRKVA